MATVSITVAEKYRFDIDKYRMELRCMGLISTGKFLTVIDRMVRSSDAGTRK